MMFATVLPLPSTSLSSGTGAVCFLAHAGSASMANGLRVGAFPSKVTTPVMVDAASATARHTEFTLLPVLVSCAICPPASRDKVAPLKAVTVRCRRAESRRALSFEKWPFVPSRLARVKHPPLIQVRQLPENYV